MGLGMIFAETSGATNTARLLTHLLDHDERGLAMKATRCSVPECTVVGRTTRGYCQAHYKRWSRTGNPGKAKINLQRRPKPTKYVGCSVEGCVREHAARTYCILHYERWSYRTSRGQDLGDLAQRQTSWANHPGGYKAAYVAVHRERGPAVNYPCLKCSNIAAQWAYDHDDPDPDTVLDERGYKFSRNPDYYIPLCFSCHVRFDQANGAR